MAKYFDVYTQIPGIKPCPQVWITAEDKMDIINQFLRKRDFIDIHNIVATDVKELSNTKTLICRKEHFACIVESQYEGEHMNEEKRTKQVKQVAETTLNAAIVISFFATFAAIIWLVWDQREIVFNTAVTALIVFVATWLFKLILLVEKELWR